MLCLVIVVVGRLCRPEFLLRGSIWWGLICLPCLACLLNGDLVVHPPCRLAQRVLGRSPRHANLLGGDLVGHPASQSCSVGTWSFPRLADLLDGDLVGHPASWSYSTGTWSVVLPRRLARRGLVKWARERFVCLALDTLFLGTRQSATQSNLPLTMRHAWKSKEKSTKKNVPSHSLHDNTNKASL
jgi:hypothetical protein